MNNRILSPLKYFLLLSSATLIGFQLGSLQKRSMSSKQTKSQSIQSSIVSFRQNTIQAPVRRINSQNQKILYSTFHKIPLAIHLYLNKQIIQSQAENEQNQEQVKSTSKQLSKHNKMQLFRNLQTHFTQNQQINYFGNIGIWKTFENYSISLLERDKCQSLQIISGPIYTKNTPYKSSNGKQVPGAYQQFSNVSKDGRVIPDKIYEIIKCNQKNSQYYVSGFTFKNTATHNNNNSLKDYQVSVQQIENETGLIFQFDEYAEESQKISSLYQFDKQMLSLTKNVLDSQYYTQKLKNVKNFDKFTNYWNQAINEGLDFKSENYTHQIDELAKIKLQKLYKDERRDSCNKLKQYILLQKNLSYLKRLQHLQDSIKQKQQTILQVCLQNGKPNQLEQIKKTLPTEFQIINQKIIQDIIIKKQQLRKMSLSTLSTEENKIVS